MHERSGGTRIGRRHAFALALVSVLALAACTSSGTSTPTTPALSAGSSATSSASTPPKAPLTFPRVKGAPARQFYLSVGDSYAAGYQATAHGKGHTTRNGFAYQLVTAARAKGYRFALANLGCAGATTGSVLTRDGCPDRLLGPGATPYSGKTQADAAGVFLQGHRGQAGLVTVAIGGNDITACGASSTPVPCLTKALTVVGRNLDALLKRLRAAAGPKTRIVGITYPDVLLGNALSKDAAKKSLAKLSVFAFQALINPTLERGYKSIGARFVDVTEATGGYGDLTRTTTLNPYGEVPVPVAKICTLTYFCQFQDIHPRTNGYKLIADLVVGLLPRR